MNFHVNFDKKEDSPIIPHRNLTMEFISLFTWQRQDFKRAAILQTHGSPRDNWVASHTRISLCFGSPTTGYNALFYIIQIEKCSPRYLVSKNIEIYRVLVSFNFHPHVHFCLKMAYSKLK